MRLYAVCIVCVFIKAFARAPLAVNSQTPGLKNGLFVSTRDSTFQEEYRELSLNGTARDGDNLFCLSAGSFTERNVSEWRDVETLVMRRRIPHRHKM